jgi:hypothetical protein
MANFCKISNETAGEHYTPREVIQLMVNLLFAEHGTELKGEGLVRTVFDPASAAPVVCLDFVHTKLNLYKKLTDPKVNDYLKKELFKAYQKELSKKAG